jgi:ATP-dependent Zn protease
LNKAMREAIAHHEAGHMVAAWRGRVKIRRATIVPAEDFYGLVDHESPLRGVRLGIDGSDRARLKAEKAILILLAGPAAQRRFRARSWRSHHGRGDYAAASDLALRVQGSRLAPAYLKWMQAQAQALVVSNWRFVRAFARRLLKDDTLEYRDVQEIMATKAWARTSRRRK